MKATMVGGGRRGSGLAQRLSGQDEVRVMSVTVEEARAAIRFVS